MHSGHEEKQKSALFTITTCYQCDLLLTTDSFKSVFFRSTCSGVREAKGEPFENKSIVVRQAKNFSFIPSNTMGSACSCCGNKHTPVAPVPKPPVSKTPVPQKHRSPTPHRAVEKPARAKAPPAPVPIEQYTKAGITTNNPLKLIEGYKDEPLVSLEEALKPFDGHITDLPDHIDDAKNDCRYPSEHKLTRDESAAIFIYSQQWQGVSVNDHLQAAWASNDRAQLKPWFKFLMLLRSALGKLPNAKAMVWQGAPHDEELKETLRSKSKPIYTSMGSASPSEYAIKEHLHETSGPKTIMIGYRSVNGKDVTGYTASRAKEVIIRPGCKLGVAKYSEVDENGSLVVHLVRETGESCLNCA